jgi:hypothetical protein
VNAARIDRRKQSPQATSSSTKPKSTTRRGERALGKERRIVMEMLPFFQGQLVFADRR